MNRRDLITLFGGIAVAWPFRARAQQTDWTPVIGLLHSEQWRRKYHDKDAGVRRPTGHGVWNDLLVMADATAQIARSRHKTHLWNRRRGRARLWKHVADFRDFTFWLLPGGVQFQAKRLAG
jgi:hypothetical protein